MERAANGVVAVLLAAIPLVPLVPAIIALLGLALLLRWLVAFEVFHFREARAAIRRELRAAR